MKINELAKAFDEMFDFITDLPSGLDGFESDFDEAYNQLELVKSDVVQEVVRCKDCKYRIHDRDFTTGRYCSLRNANGGKYCKDDDYCSYGKRKEGDKNNG